MSVKPIEVFPDIHHKMSKKIAQLTKVIYHLNTRNEDHQADMDALSANHQQEIQQILKDAASRINKFKEDVEVRQTQVNQDHRLIVLQKKFEDEKSAANQDIKNLKKKLEDNEKRIAADYQQKLTVLKEQVELMNSKFAEKVREFEASTQTMKQQLADGQSKSTSGLSDLQKIHDKEIQELVRTSNEKYQNMIIEQLRLQEILRAEMNALVEKAKVDTTALMQAEQDRALGQLRAQLTGDRQEAIMKLTRDHEVTMNSMKQEYNERIEKISSELKAKSEELNKLRVEKDNLEASLRGQLKKLESDSSSKVRELEEKIRVTEESLLREKNQSAALACTVQEKSVTIEEKVAEVSSLQEQVERLRGSLDASMTEIERLKEELVKASRMGASSESALREQMAASRKESENLRSEIVKLNSVIDGLKNDIKQTSAAANKASTEAVNSINSLKSDIASLTARLEDALSQNKNINQNMGNEMNQLRKSLADSIAAHKLELEQRNAAHNTAIFELREKHRLEMEQSANSRQELLELAKRRENEITEDSRKQALAHAAQLEDLKGTYVDTIKAMELDFETQKSKMKSQIVQLEAQIAQLSEQADGEKGNLRSDVQRLEAKSKALQKDLDAKKKDVERVEGVCNGLKTQVESLREELKASQKAFREKMDMSLATLDAEWAKKMEDLKENHNVAMTQAVEETAKLLQSQLDELTKTHKEELESLKSALQKEAMCASDQSLQAEKDISRLQGELEKEKKLHLSNLEEASKLRTTLLSEASEIHAKELEKLRRELQSGSSSREAELVSRYTLEIEELKKNWQSSIVALTEQMASEQETTKAQHEAALSQALDALRAQLLRDKNAALDEAAKSHSQQMANLNNSTTRAVTILNEEIEALKRNYSLAQQEVQNIEKQLAAERTEKFKSEERHILEKDQLQREHQTDIRKERERSERALMEASERASYEVKMVRDELKEEMQKMQDVIKHKNHEIATLNERYKNRESRQEDLDIIRKLQEDMVAKDVLVQQTKEEMLYFKREMLNREESYNTKFNRSPNVGVMNVLKTKEPAAHAAAPGARKASIKGGPPAGPGPMLGLNGGGLGPK